MSSQGDSTQNGVVGMVCPTPANYFIHSELITVVVGRADSNRKTFQAHKDMLCGRSPFFNAALNGAWIESKTNTVTLPADDLEIFALWLQLAYTGNLPLEDDKPGSFREKRSKEYIMMAKVYVLSEKFIDIQVKNKITEAMLARSQQPFERVNGVRPFRPDHETTNINREGTMGHSPMRRLLVDTWFQRRHVAWSDLETELYPSGLFAALAQRLMVDRRNNLDEFS